MRTQTPAVLPRTERRIRREARSATLRERALALRQAGWTYAAIGQVLGVSLTRAYQLVRKAERLIRQQSNEEGGAPAMERPSADSTGPLAADRNNDEQGAWVYRPAT